MQALPFLGALGALVVHSAVAVAAPPAWCKGGNSKPHADIKSLYTETDAGDALVNLVAATCYPDEDLAPHAAAIAKTRDAWSKRLALVEDDWAEVSTWAHMDNATRGANTFFVTDPKAAFTAYSPLDQFGRLGTGRLDPDASYVADAFGAKLSLLGRLGYVQHCLDRATHDDGPVALAMCAGDAAMLDMAKLSAEIRADRTHPIEDRMTARLIAYEITSKMPATQAAMAALRSKDPAYATMFSLADASAKQWATVDPTVVALVTELDDARQTGSRKASQGCLPRARDAWKAVVASIGAKKLATIHPVPGNGFAQQLVAMAIAQPSGYLAALALTTCATLEGHPDLLTRVIGAALQRWPGFRGPRTGTQTAIATAGLTLDQRDARIDYPEVSRDWIAGDSGTSTSGFGAIASVKIDGESVTVTFAKQKVTQQRCTKGHYTNRVSQIMSDGTVVYYYVCDTEITETIEVAPSPPMKLNARYAVGLAAGMTVSIIDDTVVVAYPKGSTTPAVVTGVVVK